MTKRFLLVILGGGLIIRLLPNLISPIQTFGYDYGFYLYAFNHAVWTGGQAFLLSAWTGYSSLLFPLFHILGLSSEPTLIATQLLLSLGAGLACYLFWGKSNKTAGVWAAALFFLSIAQSQVYLMFLWKNLFGLVLFILSLRYAKDQKYFWALTALLATVLTHRTSAILLTFILVIYAAAVLLMRRAYRTLAAGCVIMGLIALLIYPHLLSYWHGLGVPTNSDVSSGIFLPWQMYVLSALPLIAFTIWSIATQKSYRENLLLYISSFITLVWWAFPLPFHNRILPYFDISIILLSAFFLSSLRGRHGKAIKIAVVSYLAVMQILFLATRHPLITKQEISEIKNYHSGNPETLVIALSAEDAPWLLGYLQDARVAAPGLFENRHSAEEWQQFWNGYQQKIFFTRYPRPLVIYSRSSKPAPEVLECAPPITQNFLNYQCK